jgi:hypothetical protein
VNDARLARLLGHDLIHGWTDEGPQKMYARRDPAMVRSWYS